MNVETVKIKADNEQGFIIINKSDFSDGQKLFDDKTPTKPVKAEKPKTDDANS